MQPSVPPSRRCRVLMRAAGVVTGLIVLLALASLYMTPAWEGRSLAVAVRMGSVYWWSGAGHPAGWSLRSAWAYRDWWSDFAVPRLRANHGWVPLWVPLVLLAGGAAVLGWRDRRRRWAGHCPRCGYDLTGNTSGRCPECGTPCAASP